MKIILGTMTFGDQVAIDQAQGILSGFSQRGHVELDTAYFYHDGKTETLLGSLISSDGLGCKGFKIATKVHPWNDMGLRPERVKQQFGESLSRLKTNQVDLLYLHSPDLKTPITETLLACYELYQQGLFKRFGLSNFAAWQVAEVAEICKRNGWMEPTVYQGMYNALTRDVEPELLPCLANYGIDFYAYNPLAGGMLSGKYNAIDDKPQGGRFGTYDAYPDRYWKSDYFQVMEEFVATCNENDIAPAQGAIRWLCHHSHLAKENPAKNGHGIILGVSNQAHLQQNLDAISLGPLPSSVIDALDEGWEVTRTNCTRYFRD